MTSELEGPPGPWDIHSHQAPRPLSHAFGEHPVTKFFLLSNQVKNTDDQHDDDDDGDDESSDYSLFMYGSKGAFLWGDLDQDQ